MPCAPRRGWHNWPEWKLVLAFVLVMLLLASVLAMAMGAFGVMLTQSGYGSGDPAGASNDRHFLIVATVIFILSLVALFVLKRSENATLRH